MSEDGPTDPSDGSRSPWEQPATGETPSPPPSGPPPPPYDEGDATQAYNATPGGGGFDEEPTAYQPQVGGEGGGGGVPPDSGWEYEPEYEPPPGPWWSQPGRSSPSPRARRR